MECYSCDEVIQVAVSLSEGTRQTGAHNVRAVWKMEMHESHYETLPREMQYTE
jgi:hypothetical protein